MTDVERSPYTGRRVDEWLDDDIELHDVDGDEIGRVVEMNPDFVVAETDGGFLGLAEKRLYYIPRENVHQADGNDWYLNIDKDDLTSKGWESPPTSSAWASGARPAKWRSPRT